MGYKKTLGTIVWLIVFSLFYTLLEAVPPGQPRAGRPVFTFVRSSENGLLAVRIVPPLFPRYPEGSPLIVEVPEFFYPKNEFLQREEASQVGFTYVSFLWPGMSDKASGRSSLGTYDYGGPACLAALRDVIRFATGEIPNNEGRFIRELMPTRLLTENVGLYAFSHPGIAATNVLAIWGKSIPKLKYFVGRENPTSDVLLSVELGHWKGAHPGESPSLNPQYKYPGGYRRDSIRVDYSKVRWLVDRAHPRGCPVFEGEPGYISDKNVPVMFGKRYYSTALTTALLENGALSLGAWPVDVATPEECRRDWPSRVAVTKYPLIKSSAPDLKVMLVFARTDHVQPQADKPHIHQAFQGFRDSAGLWVRLNPDRSYIRSVFGAWGPGFPDNDACAEPADWLTIGEWATPNLMNQRPNPAILVPLAAWAEMADRVRTDNWENNLDGVIRD
jgi:hypothetical protein